MNKRIEAEMRAFRALVDSHLARMIARVGARADRPGQEEQTVREALLWCWANRQWLDPVAWLEFFEEGLDYAESNFAPLVDGDGLMAFLNRETQPARTARLSPGRADELPELNFRPGDDPLGPNQKDCPPCWRCRYFDGWLPTGKVQLATSKDPDVQESMRRIDANKIRVAQWVRSRGLENLEKDS